MNTAKYMAFQYLYSINYIVLNKPLKFDKRTRVGKEANRLVQSLRSTINVKEVYRIKRERAAQKRIKETVNIFEQPLVKDYLNNKQHIKAIHKDRIEFYGRNHWVKNSKDFKILAVLNKFSQKN
jgi:hypothetical protein